MKPLLATFLLVLVFSVHAQTPFTKVENAVAQLGSGSCSFGDLDKDGDSDLLLTGSSELGVSNNVVVYLNDNGSFTPIETGIRKLEMVTATDMGDFDNDGDLDIIIGGGYDFYLYVNESLSFTEVPLDIDYTTTHPPSDAKFVDLDNDGQPEIVSVGLNYSTSTGFSHVYKLSNGSYNKVASNLTPGYLDSKISIADFNRDGWNDLLISNRQNVKLFMNQKGLNFQEIIFKPEGNSYNQSATGDFNNDGFVDFVLCGAVNGINEGAYATKIYLNNGSGEFHVVDGALPAVFGAVLGVADFNMDGLDDIFLSGMNTYPSEAVLITGFYQNNGDMTFTKLNQEANAVRTGGDAEMIDVNNDTKPDLFVSGVHYIDGIPHYYSTFYINNCTSVNEAPTIPDGLDMERDGSIVTFNWNKSHDDHTKFPRYNVRIGTVPDGHDVLSPPINGDYPLLIQNFTTSDTFKVINVNTYERLYVSVQAVDNSLRYSSFSDMLDVNFQVTITGLEESVIGIEVFPNPVDATLFVKSSDSNVSYFMADGSGYRVMAGELTEHQIDVSKLAAGIYFLTITKGKQQFVKRIVKR